MLVHDVDAAADTDDLGPCETEAIGILDRLHLALSCLKLDAQCCCYSELSMSMVAINVDDSALVKLLIKISRLFVQKLEPKDAHHHSFFVKGVIHSNLEKVLLVA